MKERISELKRALAGAACLDEKQIAYEVRRTGFKCKRCARCCKEDYGDNTVCVFPLEIRRISEKTGLGWNEIAFPAPSRDRDSEGNIHTFEWVLERKSDCRFLKNNLCRIYRCRPYICRTYPFYLIEGRLTVSECDGLGGDISDEDAMKLAVMLKERYITEIRESIALLEKFRGFKPGGRGNICVHDSEGEHWLDLTDTGKI